MEADEEYRIERITKEKLKDLVYLFKSNNNDFSERYFEKKFDTSYTGASWVGYLAYHRTTNEPAAFYGVFPVFLLFDGKQILAAQSGDTITHYSHQKKGLFIFLARRTYELCCELKIQIVFGFPNKKSSHGFFEKLNWRKDGKVYRYVIPTSSGIFKRIMRKLMPKSYYEIIFKRFKSFNPSTYNTGQLGIDRTPLYINYKCFSSKYVYSCDEVDISFICSYDLHIGNIYFKKQIDSRKLLQILGYLSNLTFTSKVILHFSEFMFEHTAHLKSFMIEDEVLVIGRLDLGVGYESKHLVFSAEDFDTF